MGAGAARTARAAGPGEGRRRNLRRALLDAGEQIFASVGFAGSSVDDVIARAGVSRASFYRYFSGKEALFVELSRACFADMADIVRAFGPIRSIPARSDRRRALATVVARYRALEERHRGVIRAWTERSGPIGSPVREDGRRALAALADTMAAAVGEDVSGPRARAQAVVLFTILDRSSAYVAHSASRMSADRLDATLSAMIDRAYFARGEPRLGGADGVDLRDG